MIQESILLTIVLAPLLAAIVAGLGGRVIGRAGAHSVTIRASRCRSRFPPTC